MENNLTLKECIDIYDAFQRKNSKFLPYEDKTDYVLDCYNDNFKLLKARCQAIKNHILSV